MSKLIAICDNITRIHFIYLFSKKPVATKKNILALIDPVANPIVGLRLSVKFGMRE